MFSLTKLVSVLGAACAITLHTENASTAQGCVKSLTDRKKCKNVTAVD
jgi:hypothetical protein